jgi:hypothetical protein
MAKAQYNLRNSVLARSFHILEDLLRSHFKDQVCIVDPLNPRFSHEMALLPGRNRALDIVLVGGFLPRALAAIDWVDRPYRLWVLCDRAKAVLEEILCIPGQQIGVVPRYELLPRARRMRPLSMVEPCTLVFGGRFSRIKGVLHTIEFARSLQMDHGFPVRLVLCGEFFEIPPLDGSHPRWSTSQLRAEMTRICDDSRWDCPPEIRLKQSPEGWQKKLEPNPTLVNLSLLYPEDYGVSIAQAQAQGWPTLLSPWGAHFDAVQSNTWLAPKIHPFAKTRQREREAKELAEKLVQFLAISPVNSKPAPPTDVPHKIDKKQLVQCIRAAESNYPGIGALKDGWNGFISTRTGKKLFARCLEIFLGH